MGIPAPAGIKASAAAIFISIAQRRVFMAKRRRRRKFNMRKVKISSAFAIGALDTADVISGAMTNVTANTLRFISLDCSWGISNHAAVIDDGYTFGVAHSDYSAVEIEECLEAGGSMDLGDKVAQEQANRLVREIGQINGAGVVVSEGIPFNDGMRVKTRLNWLMSIGDSLHVWVRNASGAIYTSGTTLVVSGNLWVKD